MDISERLGEYQTAPPVLALADGWEAEVIRRLRAMVARQEVPLVSLVQVGEVTLVLIDRRVPAGRVVVKS